MATDVAERRGLRTWLLQETAAAPEQAPGPYRRSPAPEHHRPWWQVMCLTGVDYFSTLGYQPGIAFLAAGVLSPVATLVLVALTLLGALPVYRRVARESPHGEGSIAMLERILPWWGGKVFVLVLLGFAATDFLITMTLSAADAAAHVTENTYAPAWLHGHELAITLVLLALLAAVFLRGFREAIGIAVVLVGAYLALNAVVIGVGAARLAAQPSLLAGWTGQLHVQFPSALGAVGFALLAFPKLALGLSGFETGVAVMPQVAGDPEDTEARPAGRVRGTKRLLTTAAVVMSCYLVTSAVVTTVLVPAPAFAPDGAANGRALAYLAHAELGDGFGTAYDASTIAILWFAGASAMAGLLNLVPRYLPRYGMAPRWTRATRPLVLLLIATAVVVTVAFDASVDAQAGAYATGVLVLMTSAAVAVTLSAHRARQRGRRAGFAAVAAVFAYTTVDNVVERPEGVRIAAVFIGAILLVSLLSRVRRAFELRASSVSFDATAQRYLDDAVAEGALHLLAHEPADPRGRRRGGLPGGRDGHGAGGSGSTMGPVASTQAYEAKLDEARRDARLPEADPVLFLEVTVADASDFESDLRVHGVERAGHRVLQVAGPGVPNTIAAVLLEVRDRTGVVPGVWFSWTEGDPIANLLRFLLVGEGEVAPVTREVLREAEPDRSRRPRVHVG